MMVSTSMVLVGYLAGSQDWKELTLQEQDKS